MRRKPCAGTSGLDALSSGYDLNGTPSLSHSPAVEDHTLRLPQRMQAEHAAAMSAVSKQRDAVKVMLADIGRFQDKIDAVAAEIAKMRTDMERGFRGLHGDIMTLGGQTISRQIETLDAIRRLDRVEDDVRRIVEAEA